MTYKKAIEIYKELEAIRQQAKMAKNIYEKLMYFKRMDIIRKKYKIKK